MIGFSGFNQKSKKVIFSLLASVSSGATTQHLAIIIYHT